MATVLCPIAFPPQAWPYSIAQITDKVYDDTLPRINEKDDIVWQGFDGRDWEIFCLTGLSEGVQ